MAKAKGFSEEPQQPLVGSNELQSVAPVRLKIDNTGRIVIPSEMRAAMMVKPGDTVAARVENGEFRITSPDVAVRRAQSLARKLMPAGVSLVDDLIAERREEARREAEEADAWRKAHGMPPLE